MASSTTATVTREDDAWIADVDNLPGAHTYARNLPALQHNLQLADQTAQVARTLATEGWSVRDIAVVLGITAGRVSQDTQRAA